MNDGNADLNPEQETKAGFTCKPASCLSSDNPVLMEKQPERQYQHLDQHRAKQPDYINDFMIEAINKNTNKKSIKRAIIYPSWIFYFIFLCSNIDFFLLTTYNIL